jgi:hypothetical protein
MVLLFVASLAEYRRKQRPPDRGHDEYHTRWDNGCTDRCFDKSAHRATNVQLHKFCSHARLRTSDSQVQRIQMIRGTSRTTTNQIVRRSFPQKNGLANSPVSQPGVREHFCNYCAARISTVYHAGVRPSRALTMERLADLRSFEVPPGSGQTRQHKRVSQD